jgi:hypothetical protein
MAEEKGLIDLLSASGPVISAGATYTFMKFVDKGASASTRNAVTTWLKKQNLKETFGELATRYWQYCFGGWLGLLKAAVGAILCAGILVVIAFAISDLFFQGRIRYSAPLVFISIVLTGACVALIVGLINLIPMRLKPRFGLIILAALVASYTVSFAEDRLIGLGIMFPFYLRTNPAAQIINHTLLCIAMVPTLLFGWAYLLAVLVGYARLLFFRATVTLQKYLEKGNDHPFEAFGWVGAAFVFVFSGALVLTTKIV